MKKTFLLLLMISFTGLSQIQVKYSLDLNQLENDRLEVIVENPQFIENSVVFYFPKMVPGTYAYYDFGRFVSDFKAFDSKGVELKTKKIDENGYSINGAINLAKISYKVDDSWDSPEIKGEYIFEPAGSNFQKDSLFALNTHCIFGYFKGYENKAVEVNVLHGDNLIGASSMKNLSNDKNRDIYRESNYHRLVDSPLMYSIPDTTEFYVAETKILVSAFSPNKMINSKQIAEELKPLLEIQKEYLGGKLPVDKYAYLIVLSDYLKNGSYGALEHSQSSFYYLPEGTIETLGQDIKDISAHEFFHVVTPLNIHSKEIGDFDFNKPKMSQHLWMYEGLTEYAAHHAQLVDSKNYELFMEQIWDKNSSMLLQYNDKVPFTKMSKKVLDKYKEEYANVYQKGALIGFGLDLTLRKISNGEYGTQRLMQDLSKKYGMNQSFVDNQLFKEIVNISGQKEIGDYFKTYVKGSTPLPVEDWLNWIGFKVERSNEKIKRFNLGFDFRGISVNSETSRIVIASENAVNPIGEKLGLKSKDELVSVNDFSADLNKISENIGILRSSLKEGDDLRMIVARKNSKGEFENIELKGKFEFLEEIAPPRIIEVENPSEEQLNLRNSWLSGI
jgi:predicted metalloprotease with PDZ domain